MGSSQVKPKYDLWEACGPIVNDMKKKYGSEAVKYLKYWHEQFEFPANGSFSESKIENLQCKLDQHWWCIIGKKKIKRETLISLEDMQRVLKMWKEEAERRRRKRERKKKSKDKTHSAAIAPQRAPPSSATASDHCNSTEPTTAPQVPLTAPVSVTVVDNSYSCSKQGPTLLPPRPGENLFPRFNTAIRDGAAAQELESGGEERAVSLRSTDAKLHIRLQPVVSSLYYPQTIPSANMKALPAAPAIQPAENFFTFEDMKDNLKHLPPVYPSGEKFAKDFLAFCKVLMPSIPQVKRLVCMHLTLDQYLKIKAKMDGNGGPISLKWEHEANAAYREAIRDLCDAILKAFPKKVDFYRLQSVRQEKGETPNEFLIRLDDVFDECSGWSKPDDYPGEKKCPYEEFLIQEFLRGLQSSVRKGVETTCISLRSARLNEVVAHATHAYECQQEAIRKREMKEEFHRAVVLSEFSRIVQIGQSRQKSGRRRRDGCFVCGAYDHWRRDCPQNTGYRGQHQRRAIGNNCLSVISQL